MSPGALASYVVYRLAAVEIAALAYFANHAERRPVRFGAKVALSLNTDLRKWRLFQFTILRLANPPAVTRRNR